MNSTLLHSVGFGRLWEYMYEFSISSSGTFWFAAMKGCEECQPKVVVTNDFCTFL